MRGDQRGLTVSDNIHSFSVVEVLVEFNASMLLTHRECPLIGDGRDSCL